MGSLKRENKCKKLRLGRQGLEERGTNRSKRKRRISGIRRRDKRKRNKWRKRRKRRMGRRTSERRRRRKSNDKQERTGTWEGGEKCGGEREHGRREVKGKKITSNEI